MIGSTVTKTVILRLCLDDVTLNFGYRIGPFEVKSALIKHDAGAESAVVSSQDDKKRGIIFKGMPPVFGLERESYTAEWFFL